MLEQFAQLKRLLGESGSSARIAKHMVDTIRSSK